MLIFTKPFKVLASYLVWTFPRVLAFHVYKLLTMPLSQRSLSRMMLMLKYLVKVYFDLFEVLALYLVGTFP